MAPLYIYPLPLKVRRSQFDIWSARRVMFQLAAAVALSKSAVHGMLFTGPLAVVNENSRMR